MNPIILTHTKKLIEDRLQMHLSETMRLQEALNCLTETGTTPVYEVHYQKKDPHHMAIKAEASKLHDACIRANESWDRHNNRVFGNRGSAQVFLKTGTMLIVVHPDDALKILRLEGSDLLSQNFSVDDRLIHKTNHSCVFYDIEEVIRLSAWHARNMTA